MSPDVHALTGAYVLDALSDDERVEFERHLDRCDTCADEVTELRETAARLAVSAAVAAPPDLRTSVLHRITEVRQQSQRLAAVAAAILVAVAATFGIPGPWGGVPGLGDGRARQVGRSGGPGGRAERSDGGRCP